MVSEASSPSHESGAEPRLLILRAPRCRAHGTLDWDPRIFLKNGWSSGFPTQWTPDWSDGFILDDYPRTLQQARAVQRWLDGQRPWRTK